MGLKERTVDECLASLAAATPTPGGGSASALAGAFSVALIRMVAGLAVGKKGYEAVQGDLARIEARAAPLQSRLVALADEDAAAYDLVLRATRLPRSTDAERGARVEAMQAAYREATKVPLETAERCLESLELAREAVDKGNRGASTDCGVAVLLAEAGVRGAVLNVRVNLASLKDEVFRSSVEERVDTLLARAGRAARETMSIVEGRV